MYFCLQRFTSEVKIPSKIFIEYQSFIKAAVKNSSRNFGNKQ